MIHQPLLAKKGEVSFREVLSDQHLGEKKDFQQEYTASEMRKILKEKVQRTRRDFYDLKKKKITLSPFLEIGSGYGQSALILTNKFNSLGYATDLALSPLESTRKTAKQLKANKIPNLVVCDAENLPFPNNSFPFIFCYQTLHHFPHPANVVREAKRVLAPGGTFFFAEEPVGQTLNLNFWRRPTKLRWWEKILKATLVLHFISRIGKTEVDHGILEESFPLQVWKEALDMFDEVRADLFPFPFGPIGSFVKENGKWKKLSAKDFFNRILLFMSGGGITGTAKKSKSKFEIKFDKGMQKVPPLACVNCWIRKNEIEDRPILRETLDKLTCPSCGSIYTKRKGIYILLEKKLQKTLYLPAGRQVT